MLQAATGHRREGGDDGTSRGRRRRLRVPWRRSSRRALGRRVRRVVRRWPAATATLARCVPTVVVVLGLAVASDSAPGLLFLHAGLAPEPVSAGMLTGRVLPVVAGTALSGLGLVLGSRRPVATAVGGLVTTTAGLALLLAPYGVLSLLPRYTTTYDLACSGMLLLTGVVQVATGLACRLAGGVTASAVPRDPFVPLLATLLVFGTGLVSVLAGLSRWWDVALSQYEADLRADTLLLVLGGCLLVGLAVLLGSLHWAAGTASGLLAGVLPGLFLLYSSSRDSRPLRSRLPGQVATGYHLSVGVPVLVGVLVVASALAVLVARQRARAERRAFADLVARVGRDR